MSKDQLRGRIYAAEAMVYRLFERAGGAHTVQIAGAEITVPAEVRFGSLDEVRVYVDRVLALRSVRDGFERAKLPVVVRARRGSRAAHYERLNSTIAVPDNSDGRWALRELVVVHELAHHLDPVGDPSHGRSFVTTLIDLVDAVLGPESALVYRVIFGDSGLL
ncbi:TIGR04338 family metallohydrolase [Gordonia sp. (in: high G+C Gram-positive bacteria)]|uniref:TIGR04338 family metallohydrolase n=1 Tax=Gordonia sp. (in: high G+C Gram-positive bacteria) TaxID=84139 RepID=UPI003C790F1D